MAGTIPLSMTQQFDEFGRVLAGGTLYIFEVGTVSTPQDAFQDYALTIPMAHPMTLDAAGRVPQFFLADGFVKIRLQDRYGVVQLTSDMVLVIGPPPIEEEEEEPGDVPGMINMGDMLIRYGTGSYQGYVRCNNNSIGSEMSGASERANADTQSLFEYLWAIDPNLEVIGGRGVSANSDWTADKQIRLPDWRGYNISGVDDMGGGFANRLSGFFTDPAVLGSAGGTAYQVLTTAKLPPQTPAGSISLSIGAVTLSFTPTDFNGIIMYGAGSGDQTGGGAFDLANGTITVNQAASSATFSGTAMTGQVSEPFAVTDPRKHCTVYMKL